MPRPVYSVPIADVHNFVNVGRFELPRSTIGLNSLLGKGAIARLPAVCLVPEVPTSARRRWGEIRLLLARAAAGETTSARAPQFDRSEGTLIDGSLGVPKCQICSWEFGLRCLADSILDGDLCLPAGPPPPVPNATGGGGCTSAARRMRSIQAGCRWTRWWH
jgi:hypothetical protein